MRVAADGEVGVHRHINIHQGGQLLQNGLGLYGSEVRQDSGRCTTKQGCAVLRG